MADPADSNGRARPLTKSPTAYRTISEVSEDLNVPQHVLRFWESRFAQVRPLKRGGGRRYYRPEDVVLLRRIQKLLYEEGYTIKGVQKLLREGRAAAAVAGEGEGRGEAEPEPAELPLDSPEAESAGPEMSDDVRAELRAMLTELRALRALLPETDE
ncbi:MAG: MerR family transcriptional regulator [Alphaproteobacteria bacterium]|jgi:DNA-binding transcriptional MerR regulator|nr:MerR family transcriptional regulator [Alphaproteobacteria bacterium]